MTSIKWFMNLFSRLHRISNFDEVNSNSYLSQNDIQKILALQIHYIIQFGIPCSVSYDWDREFQKLNQTSNLPSNKGK